MTPIKRWLGFSIAAAMITSIVPRAAIAADTFPTRPMRIIVNTAPGGATDVTTRVFAPHMGEYLKQSVVVENRAGGDGLIGIRTVKSATPDGYTLLSSAATVAQQMAVQADPGYDLLKDFTGIGILARAPYLMLVGAPQPDRTVADFIKRAKASPGKLSYASAGNGTVPHFVGERFLRQAGISVLHVPYKGNGAAMADVMSGRVDMIFGAYAGVSGQIKAGQVRALGIAASARIPVLPDVPTLTEQAVPFLGYTYVALLAPVATPKPVVQRLFDALRWAKSRPAIQQRYRDDATEDIDLSLEQFKQFLQREVVESRKLAKELGLASH
jgi:tripartite-type tricarboxylate transporter receptor subunit TctC